MTLMKTLFEVIVMFNFELRQKISLGVPIYWSKSENNFFFDLCCSLM